jgi:hypothetical protein
MSDHAILSASGAPRWVPCPASIQHEAKYAEKPPHPMTLEGDAIHEMCKTVLMDFVSHDLRGHTMKRDDFLGKPASNGVIYTDDMLNVGEKYIREIMRMSSEFKGCRLLIEHRVYMPNVHPDNWGTLDAAAIFLDTQASLLVLADLKCGWGIVEAYENWQLLDYCVGVLNYLVAENLPIPQRIQLRLIQPRPYHPQGPVRTFEISLAELEPYFLKLRQSAHEALGPSPSFTTGPHCDHCKGRETCPAMTRASYRIVETVKGLQMTDITGASLGAHLFMLDEGIKLLGAFRDALGDKALIDIQNGKPVPGWSWETTESRVKWTKPIDQVYATGDLYGVDLRIQEAPTPKQAIAKGLPEAVVKTLSASSSSGVKLVPADLKVPAKLFKPTK